MLSLLAECMLILLCARAWAVSQKLLSKRKTEDQLFSHFCLQGMLYKLRQCTKRRGADTPRWSRRCLTSVPT